ncbi:hypothetical protein BS47DRAFT_1390777 [Hydnum rufescens UP504]|uniref:Uncharacterized protein n=1 Tax=Hydnum rufescens UP504 TaxID=1448309 RepID=A0A9P6B2Q4_9AGAM|nr:hypothetical protein BS47DRAFT_1390777 [Hydnum rufescens UP504]
MTAYFIVLRARASITEAHAPLYGRWLRLSKRAESHLASIRWAPKCLSAMNPAGLMAMGRIPATSVQVVIRTASGMSKWLETIPNSTSNPLHPAIIADCAKEQLTLSQASRLTSTTINTVSVSLPTSYVPSQRYHQLFGSSDVSSFAMHTRRSSGMMTCLWDHR